MILNKNKQNPIIRPNPMNLWESKYVFNPGVIHDGEIFHMLYRAQGPDMVSRFGYAVSKDGISFNRMTNPVLEPESSDEVYGVEDPRITFIDGSYHVCYTIFSPENIKVALAVTDNFIVWKKKGIILNCFEKDAALLPEKIGNKYVLFFSIEPEMYLSFSEDKLNWEKPQKIASPRKDKWDNRSIGIAGVPIKTPYGWLAFYYGSENAVKPIYRLGLMLLDIENPSRVLKRSSAPVMEPVASWEISGGVPYVVYSCAALDIGNDYYVYYGGADSSIGMASISKEEVKKHFLES